MFHLQRVTVAVLMLLSTLFPSAARAQYVPQGPFVAPAPGCLLPGPRNVPGKEFAGTTSSLEEVLQWDGAGGVRHTRSFADSRPGDTQLRRVDALGTNSDSLFSVLDSDQTYLLFSVGGTGYGLPSNAAQATILWEKPARCTGPQFGVWAGSSDIDRRGLDELDALEVWGPESQGDSDRYSLFGDPAVAGLPRVSVWAFDTVSGTSSPFFAANEIALAIGRSDLAAAIDVDAMLMFEHEIIFSIAPIDGFDGGEIWVWDGVTPGGAAFLRHGGHLWDTSFDVAAAFGLSNGIQNVASLEAVSSVVPEGSSLALFLSSAAGLIIVRRQFRRKPYRSHQGPSA